jgi:hypothetical protein
MAAPSRTTRTRRKTTRKAEARKSVRRKSSGRKSTSSAMRDGESKRPRRKQAPARSRRKSAVARGAARRKGAPRRSTRRKGAARETARTRKRPTRLQAIPRLAWGMAWLPVRLVRKTTASAVSLPGRAYGFVAGR